MLSCLAGVFVTSKMMMREGKTAGGMRLVVQPPRKMMEAVQARSLWVAAAFSPPTPRRGGTQKLIGDFGVTYLTTSRRMSKADASLVVVSLLVASTTMVTPFAKL
jgi:hypothetical protein